MAVPKVSVVIPVYNTEKYLKHCIESLTHQTLKEIEIIIVDDGSKEQCALLCDELAKSDERIRVIHKKNEGQGLARNTGINASVGEYIGFVDSDDYVDLKMYETLYTVAQKNDADIVMSGISFVGGNTFSKAGEYIEKNYFDNETIFENENVKQLILGVVGALPHEPDDSRYGVSVCKNIFKGSLLRGGKTNFVSERKIISEDAIFMVDFLSQTKKAVGISGAFYRYRRNDQSFSKQYRNDRFEKVLIFLTELEEHIKETFTRDEYDIYLKRLIQGYARILCSQEIMYASEQKTDYLTLCKRLKTICENELILGTLKSYPWYKLPKKQAAFAFAMRYKFYFLQKLMVLFRAR